MLFFCNFLFRIELERSGTIIFIFSLSGPFPTCFGLKGCHNFKMVFLFSLFHVILQPILAENEAIVVFFNFLNFFAIFLEFSITRCVGAERTDNFYFLFFSAFSNLFWLEMKPYWDILIFYILLLFFWNFELRVG